MVGIARSKGCRICVQRRVKCDQAEPICNNCRKGNRPCPGYGSDIKFHDEGVKLRKRFERREEESRLARTISADVSISRKSTPHFETPDDYQKTKLVADGGMTTLKYPYSNHQDEVNQPQISDFVTVSPYFNGAEELEIGFTALDWETEKSEGKEEHPFRPLIQYSHVSSPYLVQHQLFSTFLETTFLRPQAHMPQQLAYNRQWLAQLPSQTGTNSLLDTSMRAVSLAHLGRVRGSEVILKESQPLYGQALRLLSNSLTDNTKGVSSDTLAATILLSFYEMFSSNSNESWVRHAGGAAALMRVRGPSRHRYGIGRQIFLAYRYMIVIESFQMDEPCFLNSPEWLDLSRQIHQDIISEDMTDAHRGIVEYSEQFYLNMLPISTFFADHKKLKDNPRSPGFASLKADLIDRGKLYRAKLKATNAKYRALLSSIGLSPKPYTTDDPVFPIYYEYANVFFASSCTGYYSVLMILNMGLRELEKAHRPEAVTLYMMENREAALECCRSVASLLSSSFIGPFFVIYALRLSLMVLDAGAERDWIVKKLFEIGSTHMRMATHIPGFAPGAELPQVRAAIRDKGKIVEMFELEL